MQPLLNRYFSSDKCYVVTTGTPNTELNLWPWWFKWGTTSEFQGSIFWAEASLCLSSFYFRRSFPKTGRPCLSSPGMSSIRGFGMMGPLLELRVSSVHLLSLCLCSGPLWVWANGSPSTAFYSECLTLKDKALIVAKIFASPFLRLVMATYLVEPSLCPTTITK